ncbi:MAG: YbaB/EbfC family nucleoid-associated protein [Bacillales bacterium]
MNMQQMVQAMQKAQREFNKEYSKLESKEFTENANGVVKITMKGDLSIQKIEILDDELLNKENKEELCDLIVLAYNNCHEKINKESEELSKKFQQGAGGMLF